MIELKNISFGYKKKDLLFNNLNMALRPGFICGLLGKNGAGKTTLLNIISGLRFAESGIATIHGLSAVKRDFDFLSKYFLVPEEFSFPDIGITAFLKTYSPFYERFDESDFFSFLKEFDVPTDTVLTKMSMGEKKKFLLSFGLATNTDVLLMDEPTNGLDIPSKSKFRKIMASAITDERLFIISTHQVKDIEGIIDQIVVLDDGAIKFDATINEITNRFTFKKLNSIEADDAVIYKEEVLGGFNAILENSGDDYSQIDIELLFNAIITNSKINEAIKTNA